jgi:hypothetical protein
MQWGARNVCRSGNAACLIPLSSPKMKKKVRASGFPPSIISLTPFLIMILGSSHGCIGEREDLHALPHLVRPRSLDAASEKSLASLKRKQFFFLF